MRILFRTIHISFFALAVFFLSVSYTAHAQLSTCNTYHAYHKTPAGFGAVYDVFASNKEIFMNATDCTSTGFNALIGHAGKTPTNFAVYEKGYVWNGSQWVQLSYATNGGTKNGVYLMGNAKFASRSKYYGINTFFVAFTCSKVSGAWKCGCRDNTCSQSYWQLQGATKGYDIATGGGGGATTGGGGGTGAGGVEIGVTNINGHEDAVPSIFGTPIRWTAHFHGHFLGGAPELPTVKRRLFGVPLVKDGVNYAAARNGAMDSEWRSMIQDYSNAMKSRGWKELLLGVWHEGNTGQGQAWSNYQAYGSLWTNTDDYKATVKRFVEIGRSVDPNIKYYWNPGCWGNDSFMQYAPDSGYIDYVGCDLYDNQNWNSSYPLSDSYVRDHFQNFIKPQLDPLVAYAKRNNIGMVFPEFGLAKRTSSSCNFGRPQGSAGGDNPLFVELFFNYLKDQNIRAIVVYHNSDWDITSVIDPVGSDCWGDSLANRFPQSRAKLNEIFRTTDGGRWGE